MAVVTTFEKHLCLVADFSAEAASSHFFWRIRHGSGDVGAASAIDVRHQLTSQRNECAQLRIAQEQSAPDHQAKIAAEQEVAEDRAANAR